MIKNDLFLGKYEGYFDNSPSWQQVWAFFLVIRYQYCGSSCQVIKFLKWLIVLLSIIMSDMLEIIGLQNKFCTPINTPINRKINLERKEKTAK